MKNWKSYLMISLVIVLASAHSQADAEILPANSFNKLEKQVLSLGQKGIKETLIVMDDDDTLTMMPCDDQKKPEKCQYLGGPAWYSWQSDLIKNNSPSAFRVAKTDSELLDISALLLAMNDMPYTDNIIPGVLHELTQKGAKLLVLTARGESNLSATESQFANLYMTDAKSQKFLSFMQANSLVGRQSGISSIAGPITPADCGATRPIAYQQGIMYVAGQNKGEMLQCLLSRTKSEQIKNIVFIDDTLQNVEDVYTAFEESKDHTVYAYHYTRLEAHKNALTEEQGKEKENAYQKIANERWLKIKASLENTLQQPAAIK